LQTISNEKKYFKRLLAKKADFADLAVIQLDGKPRLSHAIRSTQRIYKVLQYEVLRTFGRRTDGALPHQVRTKFT
jgi:hypothetical protein